MFVADRKYRRIDSHELRSAVAVGQQHHDGLPVRVKSGQHEEAEA